MALSALVLVGLSLLAADRRDTGSDVSLEVDIEAGHYHLQGPTRSSPTIQGRVVDMGSADIDADGLNDRIVIDDRDSAAGNGIATVFDVSLNAPYAFWACPLQTPDLAEAVETCRAEYSDLTAQRGIAGLNYIHQSTRVEGVIDWETQYLAIPNWTDHITSTLTRQNVERARLELSLARASGEDTAPALDALHAALLLREQHTNFHPIGE